MIEALLMLVFLYVTLFIHEGTHWLIAKAYGADIWSFKPYPHLLPEYTPGRRFYFGRVGYTITGTGRMIDKMGKQIAVAPMVFSLIASIMCLAGWQRGLWEYLWIPAATEGLNLAWWWAGYAFKIPGSDGAKWRN